jgi:hypothetical protein
MDSVASRLKQVLAGGHAMRRLSLALCIGLLWALPAIGLAEERHSGQIVSIDPATATLVLDELSASRSDAPAGVRRTVQITPDTRIELIERSEDASTAAWPGSFTAIPCAPAELRPGDFVTVTGSERDGRMHASALDVVRTESVPSASPR